MDIFKQKRNLVIAIIVLVVLNLTTLLLLWLGKPRHNLPIEPKTGLGEKEHIHRLLKEELDFTNEQAEQYIASREEHRKNTARLNKEVREIKKEMFDSVLLNDETALSDSLLDLSLEKQKQLEKSTFQHFQELKKICNPDQQIKLMKQMHKLLGPPKPERMGDPPPPGENREDPLLPPRGERPPKRN